METQTMNKRIDMHGILPDSQKLHTYLKIRIYSDLDRCAQHIKRLVSCQKNIYKQNQFYKEAELASFQIELVGRGVCAGKVAED